MRRKILEGHTVPHSLIQQHVDGEISDPHLLWPHSFLVEIGKVLHTIQLGGSSTVAVLKDCRRRAPISAKGFWMFGEHNDSLKST